MRLAGTREEVDLALIRLKQSFSTVTPGTPLRLRCCDKHVRVQVRCTF